jgi:hypothetical protein
MAQPTSPIHQTNPLIFSEPIDSTGKAKIRGRLVATASSPEISQQDLDDLSSMGVVSNDNQPLVEVYRFHQNKSRGPQRGEKGRLR